MHIGLHCHCCKQHYTCSTIENACYITHELHSRLNERIELHSRLNEGLDALSFECRIELHSRLNAGLNYTLRLNAGLNYTLV